MKTSYKLIKVVEKVLKKMCCLRANFLVLSNPTEVDSKRKLFWSSVYDRWVVSIINVESMFLISPGGMGKKIGPILSWN